MPAKVSPQLVGKPRQLKVRFCPDPIHLKIEKWARKQGSKRDTTITKEDAIVELLYRATSHIKNRLAMTRHELIQAAYKASGYRYTTDILVINDRNAALSKLSDSELLAIIQNKSDD